MNYQKLERGGRQGVKIMNRAQQPAILKIDASELNHDDVQYKVEQVEDAQNFYTLVTVCVRTPRE